MNLVAPLGLAALLLGPVILLIHLWRVRYRRRHISSTLLWQRALHQAPRHRPRNLPTRYALLALQLLTLGCGAVALAHPLLITGTARQHLLVGIDTGLEMSAHTGTGSQDRLSQAVATVRTLITNLTANESMTLLDAGPEPRVLADSSDHDTLAQALAWLTQKTAPSTLTAIGGSAEALLTMLASTSGRDSTETYLLTAPGLSAARRSELSRTLAHLHLLALGSVSADRGVAGLSIGCVSGHCEAVARLVNNGPALTTTLAITLDNTTQSQRITLPAHSSVPVSLDLPTGVGSMELTLHGQDALPDDDSAWAVVPLPVTRHILLVTSDPTSPLIQALNAIPQVNFTMVSPNNYSDDAAQHVDLTITDALDPSLFQPDSNLLMVNPLIGQSNGTVVSNPYLLYRGISQAPGVISQRPDDPLLNGVDLSSLVIASATRATLPSWAEADVQGDSGPLLYSGHTGGRRVAVLLFDPRAAANVNASNLASLAAFPTLLRNAILNLAPLSPSTVAAGETVSVEVARQTSPTLHLLTSKDPVTVVSSGDVVAVTPLHPGLYSLSGGVGGAAALVAANAAVPNDPLGAPRAPVAAAPQARVVAAASLVNSWDGWALVVVLAILVLGGEWLYYTRRT